MNLDPNGLLFLNETANANMTTGLTINQGPNDDEEAIALKNSDIAHGYTGATVGGGGKSHETDTFAAFQKKHVDYGGLEITSLMEDVAGGSNLQLTAVGGYADTGKTNGAEALCMVSGSEHDGSGTVADVQADGNVFGVECQRGGGIATLFLVDEDGDILYDSGASAFDSHADAELCRTMDITLSPAEVIRTRWDEQVRYNKDDLVAAGIVGYCSDEEEARGLRGMINLTQHTRLMNGAIWQTHVEIQQMKEDFTSEIDQLRSKNALLEQRLNRLEN
jgi:hypothetical protein